MLKEIFISNIVLIESERIAFGEGFNVISGETGSGKSAIMEALSLVIGERADSSILRRGTDKGSVEAIFDIQGLDTLKAFLDDAGFENDGSETLIIRREITAQGKNRCWINHHSVLLAMLKKAGEMLVDNIGQHANQRLLSLETHRDILDIYGSLLHLRNEFSESWSKEASCRQRLQELQNSQSERLRQIDNYRHELEEIQDANIKEGEEEELFAEYSLLANAEDLLEKVHDIIQAISSEKQGVMALLLRQRSSINHLKNIDPSFADLAQSFENACLELQEVAQTLRNYQGRLDPNPQRLAEVNERLALINRLKRKYGAGASSIQSYEAIIQEKLKHLEGCDLEIEEIEKQLESLQKANDALCRSLTSQRKEAAEKFEQAIVEQLRSLNMPRVEFYIEVAAQKRTSFGDDRIEFFLVPNIGEHRISVRECASGGELSRLMLSIQTILSDKKLTPTLIFDEIDSNIGGETAAIVGSKLKEIGKRHQLLCITHFPQVAAAATHHLQIAKREVQGRTFTTVTRLTPELRQHEIERMTGLRFGH